MLTTYLKTKVIPKHANLGKNKNLIINIGLSIFGFYLSWKLWFMANSMALIWIMILGSKIEEIVGCHGGCANAVPIWEFFRGYMLYPCMFIPPFLLTYFTRLSLFTLFLKRPLMKKTED